MKGKRKVGGTEFVSVGERNGGDRKKQNWKPAWKAGEKYNAV